MLASLVAFGLDVARLNLSHGRRDEHQKRILTVREVARRAGRRVAIMLDTRGPEVRVGHFLGGQVELQANSRFTLTAEPVVGTSEIVSMNTPALAAAVTAGCCCSMTATSLCGWRQASHPLPGLNGGG